MAAYNKGGYGSFDKQYAFGNYTYGYYFRSLTYFKIPFVVFL